QKYSSRLCLCIELLKCKLDAADWQVGDTFLRIETGAGEQSNAARSIAGLSNWLVKSKPTTTALAAVDLPVSFAVISHLQKPVPGVVALATVGADQVTAPGRALMIVGFRDRERRSTTARDQKHAQRRVVP
ncbi:MAG: hypothetical protein WA539_19910, partial [Candidatus Sulfotelmatobacter sp.]